MALNFDMFKSFKDMKLSIKGLSIWSGLATVAGVASLWLKPGEKSKRLRIELEKLKSKKSKLLKGTYSKKNMKSIIKINERIDFINLYFRSKEN